MATGDIRMTKLASAGTLALALAFASLAPALAGTALVGNENGGTISLIDTARDEVVGEIKTGGKPRGTAILASRRIAYVSDQPANALLVVDLDKRAVTKRIDLGESPEGVYISPDGKLIAAAVELTNSVVFIDTATDAVAFGSKSAATIPSTPCSRPTDVSSTSAPRRTTSSR
jgi:YVTN family beta-propeller protein